MLIQLKEAHNNLIAIADELECLSVAHFDERAVAHARWRLARERNKRIRLIEGAIVPHLLARVSPAEAHEISELQGAGAALATAISAHIGEWTPKRIALDWSGFQQSSRQIRTLMLERVANERSVFYPLLERYPS